MRYIIAILLLSLVSCGEGNDPEPCMQQEHRAELVHLQPRNHFHTFKVTDAEALDYDWTVIAVFRDINIPADHTNALVKITLTRDMFRYKGGTWYRDLAPRQTNMITLEGEEIRVVDVKPWQKLVLIGYEYCR